MEAPAPSAPRLLPLHRRLAVGPAAAALVVADVATLGFVTLGFEMVASRILTPLFGSASVTRAIGDEDGGSAIDSTPADVVSGIAMSSVSTERPARATRTRGGAPSMSGTGWPSSRASRAFNPAGI